MRFLVKAGADLTLPDEDPLTSNVTALVKTVERTYRGLSHEEQEQREQRDNTGLATLNYLSPL